MNLTIERLRELLSYDPATGAFTWACGGKNRQAGVRAGTIDVRGYVVIGIDYRVYKAHRLAWAVVHGRWPRGPIDHINTVRHDNRIANLREANAAINSQNQRRAQVHNKSGYLGVNWDGSQFRAQLWVNGKNVTVGRSPDPAIAHEAYVLAKRELHQGSTL